MDQKRIRELEQKISTDYGNTTGVAVLKEGKLVYEKYFKGCTRESQVHVYSVTKSIISILILLYESISSGIPYREAPAGFRP